jgi:nitrogen fixation NifU-like protein
MVEPTGSYNSVVMDHFKHPRNMGEMEDADGVGNATNPVCGDTMRLFIKVEDQRIVAATFLTFGCGAAIAASSMTTEMIKGRTIEEALGISDQDVVEALGGLPPTKVHCSVLAERALGSAIADYRAKKGR